MAGQWLPPSIDIENGATFEQMAQGIPPLPASVFYGGKNETFDGCEPQCYAIRQIFRGVVEMVWIG